MPTASLTLSCLLLALLGSAPALATDARTAAEWPQFRGAGRDGVSPETGLARTWPPGGPPLLWRRPLGEGFSGIAIAGGRLYTMAAEGDKELALCLDAATGAEVWRAEVGPLFRDEFGNGPRSTPTLDGDTVYVLGAKGRLQALRRADGSRLWQVDLLQAFQAEVPTWGYAASPLIDGDLLLLEVAGTPPQGPAVAALDRRTGKPVWTARQGTFGYSSPIAVTIGGVRQYVFALRAGPEIVSLLPSGEVLWSYPGSPGIIAMPLFVPPDRIFASADDDLGGILLQVKTEGGKTAPAKVWQSRSMKNHFNTVVLVGEHLYGFDNATLKCVSAATGQQAWAYRGLGKGSVLAADGLLVVLGDRGTLVLAEATPAGFAEKGSFQALEGKSWTPPSLAGGRLYVRDQDEIACFDLTSAKEGRP